MSNVVEVIINDVLRSGGGFSAMKSGVQEVGKATEESNKSIGSMDTNLDDTGSKMLSTGKKIGGAIGVAVGSALTYGYVNALEFDSAQKKLEASFPAGSEMAKVAGEAAGKLYAAGYAGSMEQIGEATRTVIQAGVGMENATVDQVQHITGEFISLSQVIGTDVGGAVANVATLVKNGLVPNMQAGIDLIAAAYQKIGPEADGLLSAVSANAQTFKRLGIDGAEAMGLIKQGMDATGSSVDTSAASFKLLVNTVLSGSKNSEKGLLDLGLATEVFGDKSKKASAESHATFSIAADDSEHVREVIDSLGLTLDSVSSKTNKAGKTTDETFKVTGDTVSDLQTKLDDAGIHVDSFTDKIGKSSGELKVVGIDAKAFQERVAQGGDTASTAIFDLIAKLKAIKDPLEQNTVGSEIFGKNWKANSQAILAFDPTTAVAGLGDIKGAGDKMNTTLQDTAQVKLKAMKDKFQEFTASMVNAPGSLGTVTTAFGAFGAGGLSATASIAGIAQALPPKISEMSLKIVKDIGKAGYSFTVWAGEAMVNGAAATASWVASGVTMAASAIASGAKMLASYTAAFVATAAQAAVSAIATAAEWAAANAMMLIATGGIILAVGAVIAIGYEVVKHWGAVKDFFGSLGRFLENVGSTMWDGIKTGARMMVNAVISYLNGLIVAINAVITGLDLVPGVSIPHVPHIPYASFASGGISSGGLAMLGEYGPELAMLPAGTQIHSHSDTQRMLSGGSIISSQSQTVSVVLDIRAQGTTSWDSFLVETLRKAISRRGGSVQTVLGRS